MRGPRRHSTPAARIASRLLRVQQLSDQEHPPASPSTISAGMKMAKKIGQSDAPCRARRRARLPEAATSPRRAAVTVIESRSTELIARI